MNIKVYTINAFAKTPEGGNPAGLVIDADNLNEANMRKIAKEVGFSETAFLLKSDKADFALRFFTPSEEVDLCGHATIASFSLLKQIEFLKAGSYSLETKAGILSIELNEDSSVMMSQADPIFYEIIEYGEIADSLNIDTSAFNTKLPCQIVSTGLKDIMIPIKDMETLNSIKPDFKKVRDLSEKYNVVGYHIFTLEALGDGLAHCRNLAPLYDIDEEAATGTSSGALASYLYKYKIIDEASAKNNILEQGYSMNRPSEINVELDIRDGKIIEVKVGGKALKLNLIEINV